MVYACPSQIVIVVQIRFTTTTEEGVRNHAQEMHADSQPSRGVLAVIVDLDLDEVALPVFAFHALPAIMNNFKIHFDWPDTRFWVILINYQSNKSFGSDFIKINCIRFPELKL